MPDPTPPEPLGSRQVSAVPLQELFAAPLRAVIQADFMAAEEFVRFVRAYGFEPDPAGGPPDAGGLGRMRMVRFDLERAGRNGRPEEVSVRLPALSLIPLPLLQVRDADFHFGVRLLQSIEPLTPPRTLGLLDPPEPARASEPMQWQAMIADQRHPDTPGSPLAPQLQANITARVRMRQADIPAGIANLLALMGETTQMRSRPLPHSPPTEHER